MTSLRTSSLLLAAALQAACSDPSSPPPVEPAGAPADIATVTVESATIARETVYDGVVESLNQATVAAQTGGRVVELPYDVGDYVEKDALIVRLTESEQKARSGAAEASLSEAQARLAEAQLNFERSKEVYEKKVIAKAQFDKARADLDAARARVEATQSALAEAQQSVGYTVIRAPYAGIVVSRHVQLGETVTPGAPLMTGVSLEHLRVVADIPQQHIAPLRKHRKARVLLPNGDSVDAVELRLPPNADPTTHTFQVLLTLPQGEHGVFPGSLVKVAFVSGEEERLLLPPESIVRRGEVTGVYVLDEKSRVSLRYLSLGTPAADGRVPVLAGLDPGERVALDPIAAGIAAMRTSPLREGE